MNAQRDAAALLATLQVYTDSGEAQTAAILRADLHLNGKRWYAALRELGAVVQRRPERIGRTTRFLYSLATVGNAALGTLGNEAKS